MHFIEDKMRKAWQSQASGLFGGKAPLGDFSTVSTDRDFAVRSVLWAAITFLLQDDGKCAIIDIIVALYARITEIIHT